MSTYACRLLDDRGSIITDLTTRSALSYTLAVNTPGTFRLTLNNQPRPFGLTGAFRYEVQQLDFGQRLSVWRATEGGSLRLEASFFILTIEYATLADGTEEVVISGATPLFLLDTRIVAYRKDTAQANKTGPADNVMKAFVREGCGPLATATARNLDSAYWSVQNDVSAGATVTIAGSTRTLLDVCQEAADASTAATVPIPLYYDVVELTERSLQFQTFVNQRGVDRTLVGGQSSVTLSVDAGTLREPRLTNDWRTEKNSAWTTGVGTDIESVIERRTVAARLTKSIWSRREVWTGRGSATDELIGPVADAALNEGRPRARFTGQIVDNDAVRYGRDYRLGDRLAASFHGARYTAMVRAVSVDVARDIATGTDQERIDAHLEAVVA